jgi:hypothetical protein
MKYAAGLFLAFLFCSCSALPSGKSWSTASRARRGSAELRSVRVDKNADWDSVQAETSRLLPLLLAKRGYSYSDTDENRFITDVVLIEREYTENWKTRRSLSAEIMFFRPGGSIPLSAGKVMLSGTKKSLSSSKVLHKLINTAFSKALKGLPRK